MEEEKHYFNKHYGGDEEASQERIEMESLNNKEAAIFKYAFAVKIREPKLLINAIEAIDADKYLLANKENIINYIFFINNCPPNRVLEGPKVREAQEAGIDLNKIRQLLEDEEYLRKKVREEEMINGENDIKDAKEAAGVRTKEEFTNQLFEEAIKTGNSDLLRNHLEAL
ncbi:MAG TPA: hypothetical protein PLK76_03845 [bacterium]|nr:hypothetical protein [bacterium]